MKCLAEMYGESAVATSDGKGDHRADVHGVW